MATVFFSGMLAVSGSVRSAVRTVGGITWSSVGGLLKGLSYAGSGVARGASTLVHATGKLVLVRGPKVYSTGKFFVAPVTGRISKTARGAITGSQKAASTASFIATTAYRFYVAIQSLLVLVFVYLIVNNLSNITAAILWLFSPLASFMNFLDRSIMSMRELLEDKVKSRSTREKPRPVDYAICFLPFLLDLILILAQELLVLLSVAVQTFIVFITRLASRPLFWLIFGLFLVISAAIEHNYIEMADTVNSFVVAGEAVTRQAFRVGNVLFDVYDLLAPMQNVAFIYTVGRIKELCRVFCPKDFTVSPQGRRMLGETEEQVIFKYQGGGGVKEETSQRRKLIDTNTMRTKINKLRGAVNKIAFGTYILNIIDLRLTAIYLILAKPLMDVLTSLSGPIERLISKLFCMMIGGFRCSFLEIFYFVGVVTVDFINSHTILNFPYPNNFACKKHELEDIDPEQCGNYMDAAKPPGSYFSALVPEGAQQIGQRPRSLGQVYTNSTGVEEEEEQYPLLECKQHPFDNSWVETLDGKVIHMSQHNKCPLSRHVFGDEFSNVKQFNMMGVSNECYVVCLHDVKFESCHNQYTGHARRLLGSCAPETVKIDNEVQARRRLNLVFPNTLFQWNELFRGKKEQQQSPLPYAYHHPGQDHQGPSIQADDLVKDLTKENQKQPKFTILGLECSIKGWEPSLERIYVNLLCMALRSLRDHGPSIESLFQSTTTTARGRNLMDPAIETQKSLTFKEWAKDLSKAKTEAADTVALVRSYVRLLHSTDKTQALDDRIDEMISVVNYQSRRELEDDSSSGGFEEPPIKDIGWCQGENMYPCMDSCVPIEDRDQCPEPDGNNNGILQVIAYYMNKASSIVVDPEAILQDMSECYKQYDIDMENVPVTLTNLEQEGGGGTFCLGMRPPFPYRFPEVEIKGINRFIASGCVVNETNVCTCDFYYRPLLNYDILTFYYTDADLQLKLVNFCTWVHHLAYVIVFQRIPWFQDGWYSFITAVAGGPQRIQPWLLYFFGDWGIRASMDRQWYCWGLNSNSAITVIAIIVLAYELVKSLDMVSVWFWSLVRRITYYHHPLFWPKGKKKTISKEDAV